MAGPAGAPSRRELLALGTVAMLAGCGAPPVNPDVGPTRSQTPAPTPSPTPTPTPSPTPTPKRQELPGGGRRLFPDRRLVGYCGHPDAPGQGRLGIGKPDDRAVEMQQRFAKPYGADLPVLPTLELITVTAHASPGKDRLYRGHTSAATIDRYLDVAVRHKGYLVLNIQPGRAKFLDEVRALEQWLARPDVGVALDPEWAVDSDQVPGKSFGSVTGEELNGVAKWLAALVHKHRLPEKLMVYHQLHPSIVTHESALKQHDGVALVKSVDGIGSPTAKTSTWTKLVKQTPKHVRMGFKLFYEEDTAAQHKLMTPKQVLALKPKPVYVMYE